MLPDIAEVRQVEDATLAEEKVILEFSWQALPELERVLIHCCFSSQR
jgi:hypothetical protein